MTTIIKPFILKNSSVREKILYNMMYYKSKGFNPEKIYDKITENKAFTPSLKGYILEALVEILIITKCFIGLDFIDYMTGKISEQLIPFKNINTVLQKKIQDGGNLSDMILKTDTNSYIGISVKNYFKARGTDCETIKSEFEKKQYDYKISFITTNKKEVLDHKYLSENEEYCLVMKKIISDGLLFDKSDIISSIGLFCDKYSEYNNLLYKYNDNTFKQFIYMLDSDIFNNTRVQLIPRLHQLMTCNKFKDNYEGKYHLIPHVPRSGKSITLLLMVKYMMKERNVKRVLVFTAVPSTIESYTDCIDRYIDFNYIKYKIQEDKDIDSSFEGIYFCSIQYLKSNKEKKKEFLKKMHFDIMFSDEAHIGSSTDKSKNNIIDINDINDNIDEIQSTINKVIFLSGTPGKTRQYYKIPKRQIYEWDYMDINLMKIKNYELLNIRHGVYFSELMERKYLDVNYDKFPTQVLERFSLNSFLQKQILQYNEENGEKFGFSFNSLLELRQIVKGNKIIYEPVFKLEETDYGKEMLKMLLHFIFNNGQSKNKSPIQVIEMLQTHHGSRKSTIEDPKMFLMYLPTNSQYSNIEPLQKALYRFIIDNDLWKDFNICYTNSISNSLGHSYKSYIEFLDQIMVQTREKGKKGCILMIGSQGTTGITYKDCDVTISLDDGKSIDLQKQKNARALTDADGKTIGINLDMNIQRTFTLAIDLCNKFKKIVSADMNNGEMLKYMLMNKLFIFESSCIPNNGACHESIIDNHYKDIGKEMSTIMDDEIYLEAIDCDDELNEYIISNSFTISYHEMRYSEEQQKLDKEISELYNGLNQDIPKPEADKILAIIEKKTEKKNGDNDELQEEINEEIQDVINKTLEIMKLWLMPFIIILSIKYKKSNILSMLDDIEIIKEIIIIMRNKKIDLELTAKNIILVKETMKSIIENNQEIVDNIREIYENAHPKQYRRLIEKHFIPTVDEKKNNAEVPTPVKLVDEMLDRIPIEFWREENKVFEPCCGKGNFVLGIFYRFYDELEDKYPEPYERCKAIVEECLYYADLTQLNIFITTEILKCEIQSRCGECDFDVWMFNSHVGDTLMLDIGEKWGVDGFDGVIGNPPYNSHGDTGTGNTIWQHFTRKSLDEWLSNDGYLVFVHPPGWRKPNTKKGKFYGMYEQMTKNNQMLYLSIHGIKDGQRTFNCGTRYDWYVIQKTLKTKNTVVNDENGKELNIDMLRFDWLPNYNIDIVQKLLAKDGEEKCKIMYDRTSYGADNKKWMSRKKTDDFKYPCIHSTPKNGVRYMYSKFNDKGHFGVSKVIFGESGIYNPIIDIEGMYGMTHGAMAIKVHDISEGNNISNALLSNNFQDVIQSCSFSSFRVDWNIFKDLKKNFWKEFV